MRKLSRIIILYTTTLTIISIILCSVSNNKVLAIQTNNEDRSLYDDESYEQKAEARPSEEQQKRKRRRKLGKSSKDTSTSTDNSDNWQSDSWQSNSWHAPPGENTPTTTIQDIKQELNEHIDQWEEILGHPIYNQHDDHLEEEKLEDDDSWGSSSWIASSDNSDSSSKSTESGNSKSSKEDSSDNSKDWGSSLWESSSSKSSSSKANKDSSSSSSSRSGDIWEGGNWWASHEKKSIAPTTQKQSSSPPTQKPTIGEAVEVVPTARPIIDELPIEDNKSNMPSINPSSTSSNIPSTSPTNSPSIHPSSSPTTQPSATPSDHPTISSKPTPVYLPSSSPTISSEPTFTSSVSPSTSPTNRPTIQTDQPTSNPTSSYKPTYNGQTKDPTFSPLTALPTTSKPVEVQQPISTPRPTPAPARLLPPPPPSFITPRPTSGFMGSPRPTDRDMIFGSPRPTFGFIPGTPPTTPRPTFQVPAFTPTTPRPTFPRPSPTTNSPTTKDGLIISQPIGNIGMSLYGLTTELDTVGTIIYQDRTSDYIEWFYNTFVNGLSIDFGISDVDVNVEIVSEVVIDPDGRDGGGGGRVPIDTWDDDFVNSSRQRGRDSGDYHEVVWMNREEDDIFTWYDDQVEEVAGEEEDSTYFPTDMPSKSPFDVSAIDIESGIRSGIHLHARHPDDNDDDEEEDDGTYFPTEVPSKSPSQSITRKQHPYLQRSEMRFHGTNLDALYNNDSSDDEPYTHQRRLKLSRSNIKTNERRSRIQQQRRRLQDVPMSSSMSMTYSPTTPIPSYTPSISPVVGNDAPSSDGNSTGTLSPTLDDTQPPASTQSDSDNGQLSCPETLTKSFEINSESTLFYAVVPSNSPESNNGILCGRLQVRDNDNGWIGLAVSPDGSMGRADAIIGIPDEESVLKYDLAGYVPTLFSDEKQTLRDTSIVTSATTTEMQFTKLLVEDDDEVPISLVNENTMLHAWGGSELGYHTGKLAFRIDLTDDSTLPPATATSSPVASDTTESPTSMVTDSPVSSTSSPILETTSPPSPSPTVEVEDTSSPTPAPFLDREECPSNEPRLQLQLVIQISYRLDSDVDYTLEEILSTPFSQPSYRERYRLDYLMQSDEGVKLRRFEDLTCTTELFPLEDEETLDPTLMPSFNPTMSPNMPPIVGSEMPTSITDSPTDSPIIGTQMPTVDSTLPPTLDSTLPPTLGSTLPPSTLMPTLLPTLLPTTLMPTGLPTYNPTLNPTLSPTLSPSLSPTLSPNMMPDPSSAPSPQPSTQPSQIPSNEPSKEPSQSPSQSPSIQPSMTPSQHPSLQPSNHPSYQPSLQPSEEPTTSAAPTPELAPSDSPSRSPDPTETPSTTPSGQPSMMPSETPSQLPSYIPSTGKSAQQPSDSPSNMPSFQPSSIDISGIFFSDLNNNGMADDGVGISNQTVELVFVGELTNTNILNEVRDEVQTDDNGEYQFADVTDGRYKVRFSLPEPVECCSPSRWTEDNDQSIIDDGLSCASYYETVVIEVGAGDSNENVNGGIVCGHCPDEWDIIVNNANTIPGGGFDSVEFSSYNAASVNTDGFVVFGASSTEDGTLPLQTGIFVRDMLDNSTETGIIRRQAGSGTEVPNPNLESAEFDEFPSFPRMSIDEYNIASRGNYDRFLLPVGESVGNTGIYFNLVTKDDTSSPSFRTGMATLGSVFSFGIFQVPGNVPSGTAFDIFPGSPAIQNDGTMAFKGNYETDDGPKTGVFYRALDNEDRGGTGEVFLVTNSDTEIPFPNICPSPFDTAFGYISTPSIANNKMVFLGLDNEINPNCGGIYDAVLEFPGNGFPLGLESLVSIGSEVPDDPLSGRFTILGDGLSYDGKDVSFWGGWGDDIKTISLCCPENDALSEYCKNDDPDTINGTETGDVPLDCDSGYYQNKTVPVNQGIFVYDGEDDGSITTVAKSSIINDDIDFVFWHYSGEPESSDPPRWRASATSALSSKDRVAYKVKKDDTVGIYVWNRDDPDNDDVVAQTGDDCTTFDPDGVGTVGLGLSLSVDSVDMERDSFRGTRLVVTITCGPSNDIQNGNWGGIYMTRICPVPSVNTIVQQETIESNLISSKALRRSEPVYENNCNEKMQNLVLLNNVTQTVDEFEISFVYAVESRQTNHDYMNDLEDWILYYVAESTLSCDDDEISSQILLRSGSTEVDDNNEPQSHGGVIKVRYPQDGSDISSKNSECDPTLSDAKGCTVWSTRLMISSVGLPVSDVHHEILHLISNALNNGTFVENVPDLIKTVYLGPQLDSSASATVHDDHDKVVIDNKKQSMWSFVFFIPIVALGVIGIVFFPYQRWYRYKSTPV